MKEATLIRNFRRYDIFLKETEKNITEINQRLDMFTTTLYEIDIRSQVAIELLKKIKPEWEDEILIKEIMNNIHIAMQDNIKRVEEARREEAIMDNQLKQAKDEIVDTKKITSLKKIDTVL